MPSPFLLTSLSLLALTNISAEAVCRPHADAYDAGAWRWLPNAAFRAQLARDPAPHGIAHHPRQNGDVADADADTDMDEEGDVTMTDATEVCTLFACACPYPRCRL